MLLGMTASKIAISLPEAVLDRARRAVARGRAASVSAYVAQAIEEKAKVEDLAEMLRAMLAETGGPLTQREKREADEALGMPRRSRRRSR
jgi:Arc/MetJ-type ribon-helix-helix transcriptional regulator